MSRRSRLSGLAMGFTLLEAALAMAVLGLAAVGVLGALGAQLRAAERSARVVTGAALAEERLARLSILPDREVELLPDSLRDGVFPAPLDQYAWRATAKRSGDDPDLVQLAVTVLWAGGSSNLESLLYRPVSEGPELP